jgi:ABC-type nitrate/sulfonate/bicarbonate transport system substrate-binding protein
MNDTNRFCRFRRLIVASLLAVGIVGATGTAHAQTKLRVGKAVPEAFSFVPLDVGIQQGFFKKRGLEIESVAFQGDAKMQQAMAADGVDLALGSGPGLAFIMKGSPVKGVCAMAGAPLLLVLTVRADGPKTVGDLKGKKIGVSTRGSLTEWLAKETARRHLGGPNNVESVALGAAKSQIAALERGDIDGTVTDIGTALDLERQGKGRILVRFNDLRDFHIHVVFATDKAIAAQPDPLRAFMAGWLESIAFMRKNKAETVKLATRVMQKDEAISSRVYDELMPMFSDDCKFHDKAMGVLTRSFVDLGVLEQVPDSKKLYTEQFLPK